MKHYYTLLVVTCCLLLSSCLQFKENIYIKADGSGTYEATLDFSNFVEALNLKLPDFISPYAIAKFFKIEKLNGFENLKSKEGVGITQFSIPSAHVYKLSAEFKNVRGLNSILAMGSNEFSVQNQVFWNGKQFEREDPFKVLKDSITTNNEEVQKLRKKLFKDAVIETRITFEQEVKKSWSENYKIEDARHTMVATSKLNDWLENKDDLSLSLRLKKAKKAKKVKP